MDKLDQELFKSKLKGVTLGISKAPLAIVWRPVVQISLDNVLGKCVEQFSIGKHIKQHTLDSAYNKALDTSFGRLYKKILETYPGDSVKKYQEKSKAFRKYIGALENLLDDDDIKASPKWKEFIQKQIDELMGSDIGIIHSPEKSEQEKKEKAIKKADDEKRKNGGKATGKKYRVQEKKCVEYAQFFIENPHDGRPPDRYRTRSIAEVICIKHRNVGVLLMAS